MLTPVVPFGSARFESVSVGSWESMVAPGMSLLRVNESFKLEAYDGLGELYVESTQCHCIEWTWTSMYTRYYAVISPNES